MAILFKNKLFIFKTLAFTFLFLLGSISIAKADVFTYNAANIPFYFYLSSIKASYAPGETINLQGEVSYSSSESIKADQINIDIDYSHLVHGQAPGCNTFGSTPGNSCFGSRNIIVSSTPGTYTIHVVYYIADIQNTSFHSQKVKEYDLSYTVVAPASTPTNTGTNYNFDYTYTPFTYTYSPIININISPSIINYNSSANISWSSDNADSCILTKDGTSFSSGTSGSKSSGPLTRDTTFDISCTNQSGTETDSAIATVLSTPPVAPAPIIATSSSIIIENVPAEEVSSADVDLIIEPISYIPSFYKGSPLFSNQGTVKIIAIPNIIVNGKKISSKSLTFTWKKDDSIFGEDSGIGKDTFTVGSGLSKNKNIAINLSISNSSGDVLAENSKVIPFNNPQVIFYENSPLYGVLYNRSINYGYNLGNREELKIVAKPYFFNTLSDTATNLNYSWNVNGSSVKLPGKTNELLLRQTGDGTEGTASVSLDINNATRIFQFTKNGFDVNFGQ